MDLMLLSSIKPVGEPSYWKREGRKRHGFQPRGSLAILGVSLPNMSGQLSLCYEEQGIVIEHYTVS